MLKAIIAASILALRLAAQESLVSCCRLGDSEQLGRLLEAGADPNEPADSGTCPLTWACQIQCVRSIQLLLEYGADPNVPSMYVQESLLFRSARLGDYEIVRLLLEYGAAPDRVQALWGLTAVQVAASWGWDRISALLLHHGADPAQVTPEGGTLLFLACEKGLERTAMRILTRICVSKRELDEYKYVARANARHRILAILEDYERHGLMTLASEDPDSVFTSAYLPRELSRHISSILFSEHLQSFEEEPY